MTASHAVVLGVDSRLVLLITYWRSWEAGFVPCLRALSNDRMGLSIFRSLILASGRTYRFTETRIIFKSFEKQTLYTPYTASLSPGLVQQIIRYVTELVL
jgi:hypothetical protein